MALPAMAQVPAWIWHRGTANADRGRAVAATAEGVYSTGESTGSFDSSLPVGGSDVVVTKHLANGTKVWSVMLGTTSLEVGTGIATYTVPATPQVYVTGYTTGGWGGGFQGVQDAFLARVNPANGALQWVRQLGTPALDQAQGVATDPAGFIYMAGHTAGTLPLNTSAGGQDGFLAKYDSAGNLLWVRQFGSPQSEVVRGVAADANNDVYVVGSTTGSFGATHAGSTDLFIVKYNSAGVQQWRKQMGTTGSESIYGVATSRLASGAINVYVVGYTDAAFDLQTHQGGQDAIVVKFDGAGNRVWSRQFGTPGSELALGIASDGGANVYITGRSNYDFVTNLPNSSHDFFMQKYDSGGGLLLTRQFGSTNMNDPAMQDDIGNGVAADINDSVYVTGATQGEFASSPLPNAGGDDYVVFRYEDGCQINTPGQCGIGYGWGDPHLVTFDNRHYDFQGAGEFIFVESTDTNAPLVAQARMQPWVNNNRVTVMTAVATRLGASRVGLYLTTSGHELRVDGVLTSVPVGDTIPVAGGGRVLRPDAASYVLSYPGGDKALVRLNGTYMDFNFALKPTRRGRIRGLLGNYDGVTTNEYALRNGTQLTPTLSFTELYVGPTSFAASWRISQAESLFDYASGQSTATFTIPDFPAAPATVADLPATERDAARNRCLAGGVQTGVFLDSCTVDVAVTQDTGFIASTARVQAQVQAQRGPQAPAPVPAGTRLYFANFGAAVGQEWNTNLISRSPNGAQAFLGPFTTEAVRLTLPATGRPGVVSLSFDLYILDAWTGDSAPGTNTWYLQQGSALVGGTFSNTTSTQSYPRVGSAARTGSIANNTLGYQDGDSTYRFKWRFDTSGTTPIVLTFSRWNNGVAHPLLAAPSWGIDNVELAQE
ncbi:MULTISPECIES: SBBP repeat-containing protein [unclassified Myxococcus]|uniref:SBBP repeat-containing protein n=1 Tax=unclassified Myxococcus TaxID=2648731 RepID=UPI001CBC7C45|nr:SBBP repeat-containing protein [Myxococcus sp. AS-1-15]MBZ4410994.1 SBBP repeat-containing protein [Myxococcus sp. XM-1-1-1]